MLAIAHRDEAIAQRRKRNDCEQRTAHIERIGILRAAVLWQFEREQQGRGSDRQVDEEYRPPTDRIDQPASDYRAERGRDCAGRGPGADRATACLSDIGDADHREARRHQQRGRRALHDSCRH